MSVGILPELKMKYLTACAAAALWMLSLVAPGVLRADSKSLMAELQGVDAVQAVAIADRWNRTHPDVTVYADAHAVVFKFPDGQVKKIPLPADKMLVALAPYVQKTHT